MKFAVKIFLVSLGIIFPGAAVFAVRAEAIRYADGENEATLTQKKKSAVTLIRENGDEGTYKQEDRVTHKQEEEYNATLTQKGKGLAMLMQENEDEATSKQKDGATYRQEDMAKSKQEEEDKATLTQKGKGAAMLMRENENEATSKQEDMAKSKQKEKATSKQKDKVTSKQDKWKREVLRYVVDEKGDTVLVDEIVPSRVFAYRIRKGQKGWRQYYRLVYNFNKVYPYTRSARNVVNGVDSTLAANNFTNAEKNAYMDGLQKDLLKLFEPIIRKMTISQGQLLCRLVDREIGKSSYELVKYYRGGFSAWFWNGVGKLFNQDLKAHYDPMGIDAPTEELVMAWEDGSFDELYFQVFGEYPDRTIAPDTKAATDGRPKKPSKSVRRSKHKARRR